MPPSLVKLDDNDNSANAVNRIEDLEIEIIKVINNIIKRRYINLIIIN